MDKDQKMRYSEAEKAIIKKTFAENDLTLYGLRNLFWQFELTTDEKNALNFSNEQLALIRKVLIPDLDRDVPLGQQLDFTHDPLLLQLNQMSPAAACTAMDAIDVMSEYLEQQYSKLVKRQFDVTAEDIILVDLKTKKGIDQDELRHIQMLAYIAIKNYIDQRINELKVLSNPPEELTAEQQKAKAQKNSNK